MIRSRIVAAVFAAGAGLAGWPGSAPAQTLDGITIATAGKSIINYLPITLAERIGAFKKHGLAPQVSDFAGGQKSIQTLVSGGVDFAVGSYENAIFLQQKGITLTAVVLINKSLGLVVGISKQRYATYKSPRDLKGYKFAVTSPGSATDRAVDLLLLKGGLTKDDVAVIGVGGGAGAVATIESGQVDGFCNADPIASRVIDDGAMVALADTRTKRGMDYLFGGDIAGTVVLTRPAFIKSHPVETQKFVAAMAQTLHWMKTAPLDEVMAQVPPAYYGAEKAAYRKSLATQLGIFSDDAVTDPADVQRTYQVLVKLGTVKKQPVLDLTPTYDNSFADKAKAK